MEQSEIEDKIKPNAALVVRQFSPLVDFEFGFNARSVAWLDEFIENQRSGPERDLVTQKNLIQVLGSFLGECIITCFGGHWEKVGDQWRICLGNENALYPFNEVYKRFFNGPQDSLRDFFDFIPLTFPDYGKLERHVRLAEDAYAHLYEARSDTERSAAYSECKESMAEAIHLARKLGLEQRVAELEKRLQHYKAVFRGQMNF